MEDRPGALSLPSIDSESAEGLMLKEDEVREVLARIERGEKIKTIARELGVWTGRRSSAGGGWEDGGYRSAGGSVRSIPWVSL